MRVLSRVHGSFAADLAAQVPEVEIVEVPLDGPPPDGVEGEVLWTPPEAGPELAAVLERGVRWVHVMGTGVDGFPFEVLGDRVLTCSRGASATPIAEWVLATMLAFEKRLPESWVSEPPRHWSWTRLGGLAGRTLALVGMGGIGAAVARRALAFDMAVRGLRRTDGPSPVPGVELVATLAEALAGAHHVVLAVPATGATRHLVDADAFAAMTPGVHLVNVARGSLVDQEALRVALDAGRVARASLDTVQPEPLPAGHWLYTHPSVRLSPHISWSSPDAGATLVELFRANLVRYVRGEPLEGVVDVVAGY